MSLLYCLGVISCLLGVGICGGNHRRHRSDTSQDSSETASNSGDRNHCDGEELSNGCLVTDQLMFHNGWAEFLDILDIYQNLGEPDAVKYVETVEKYLTEDVEYVFTIEGFEGPQLIYSGRDDFLYGNSDFGTQGLVIDAAAVGNLNLYTHPGYATCWQANSVNVVDGELEEKMVYKEKYTARGGDWISGSEVNTIGVLRIESYWTKDSCDDDWKMYHIDFHRFAYFGTFEV